MRFYFIGILLLISISVFSQRNRQYKRVGLNNYNDIIIGVKPGMAFLDKNQNIMIGGYGCFLFNNTFYTGFFFDKKVGVTAANTKNNNSLYFGGNLKFDNAGFVFGGYLNFTRRTLKAVSNHRVRLNYSIKTGVARLYVNDKVSNKRKSSQEIVKVFTPSLGIEIPITKFLQAGIGGNYYLVKNNIAFYTDKQISGAGGYVNIHINLFELIK